MKEVVILMSDINLTPCTVTVSPQDIDSTAKLPPKDLMAGSRLSLIPYDSMSRLNSIKRTFSTLAMKYGFEFNGLTIVPREREEALLQQIEDEVIRPGMEERQLFLDRYDDLVKAQKIANPEWEPLLEKHAVKKEKIAERINFGCITVPFMATDSDFGKKQFELVKTRLVPTLVADIADMATEIMKGPVGTRDRFPSASLGPVNELLWKLNGFALLDHRITNVCAALKACIDACPVTGPVSGTTAYTLASVIRDMTNTNLLLDITSAPSVQADLLDEPVVSTPVTPIATAPIPVPSITPKPPMFASVF